MSLIRSMPPFAMAAGSSDTRRPVDLFDLVVWTIRDQKAGLDRTVLHDVELSAQALINASRGYEPGASPSGWGVDSIVRAERNARIGVQVTGHGPSRGVAPRVHPDAEAVMAAIRRLRYGDRVLILEFAQIGEPPPWSSGRQQLIPVPVPVEEDSRSPVRHVVTGEWQDCPTRWDLARRMKARGEMLVDEFGRSKLDQWEKGFTFRSKTGTGRQVLVRYCPVEPYPPASLIESTNAVYARWHAAMVRLLGRLEARGLRDHRVAGFGEPAKPWR